MQLTETHTHLYAKEFDLDRDSLIERAIKNGITKFYMPNIDSTSIEPMLAVEKNFPENCFSTMGLHPCSVNQSVNDELNVVESWLKQRSFKAIGEIGIDLYWDKTFLKEQQFAFITQINWALQYHLPIIIHCREAFDEIYNILLSFKELPLGIFHCFSGNTEQAKKILAFNRFKLGIGGVVTFKNSGLDKVVEEVDLQDLVLETDAPYLAPVPFRGKRNEPVFLLEVAKKIADIKSVSMLEVAQVTSQNAVSIFEQT